MKKLILVSLLLTIALKPVAQTRKHSSLFDLTKDYKQKGRTISPVNLFQQYNLKKGTLDSSLKNARRFRLINTAVKTILKKRAAAISLSLPFVDGKTYNLELIEQKINTASDFAFGEISNNGKRTKLSSDAGLHYRGCVSGDSSSFAAFSFFENGDVMGLFSNSEGNFVFGKKQGDSSYVLYNSDELKIPGGIDCATDESLVEGQEDIDYAKEAGTLAITPSILCKKVRFYWELDYNLYRNNFNSNLVNVQNYAVGLFNQVATMYQNEGIAVELSETYVWTVQDPYRTDSSSHALSDFRSRWNALGQSYNGDLAHLITGGIPSGSGGNGGIAYVDVLCIRSSAYGYSNVKGTYKSYPTYSWDVEVLTHEIGHNMGSRHTQWCGWNTGAGGTCGAIDNCVTLETANSGCSSCSSTTDINALPAGWKGTVMSYCHLKSNIGIDLSQGFGPLPQAKIRGRVSLSSCLVSNTFWTGSTDSLWSKAANWSCGILPNSSTDVTIQAGVPNFPVVTGSAVCRKLNMLPGADIKIKTGASFVIGSQVSQPLITPPTLGDLYITGAATPAGVMNAGDAIVLSQKFARVTNTLFEIPSLYLTGGASYSFVPQYGDWSSKYGFTGTALANATAGDAFKINGTDLKAPAASGFYHIAVDFQRARFFVIPALAKVFLPTSGELYITGNATPGGVMAVGAAPLPAQKFTKISNTLYEISIALTGNGSYALVPVYGSWLGRYGGVGAINTNNTAADYFKQAGTDLKAPPVTGNYKITVDFQQGVFTLTKL
ncbi:MAG: M12 family metallo-peptidase [Ferruginibacter sp.]